MIDLTPMMIDWGLQKWRAQCGQWGFGASATGLVEAQAYAKSQSEGIRAEAGSFELIIQPES